MRDDFLHSAVLISKDGKAAILIERSQLPPKVVTQEVLPQFFEHGLHLQVQWTLSNGKTEETMVRPVRMTPLLWSAVQRGEALWTEINEEGQITREISIVLQKSP